MKITRIYDTGNDGESSFDELEVPRDNDAANANGMKYVASDAIPTSDGGVLFLDLPQGYETVVGERAIRLSGGQKQRIGIARALYHDPDFIVFDEATSALDTLTEKKVMKALIEFSGTKTLVMIAHRLSTLEVCDQILVLKKGRMVGLGSYAELNATNPTFKQIVNASSKD
mgnify:CR=1 FL=1